MSGAYATNDAIGSGANDTAREAAREVLNHAAAVLRKAATILKEAGDSDSATAAESEAVKAETAAAEIKSDTDSLKDAAKAIGSSDESGVWKALTEASENLTNLAPDSEDDRAAEDGWLLEKDSALTLGKEKYVSFRGKTYLFADDTGWNFSADKFIVSGDKYRIVRGPATLTFALKTYVNE